MTEAASRFVGPVTLAGITGQSVRMNMWDAAFSGEMHVELAKAVDLVLVVPATADALARFAEGRADDLVAALVLCARGPVLVAPAMHPSMWGHPATEANVATLARHGRVTLVGPVQGARSRPGEEGMGRMAEPAEIVAAAEALLGARAARDLRAVRLVVTAGPTEEALDPVRFLSNRSSGTMGFAIAERAEARGALVTADHGSLGAQGDAARGHPRRCHRPRSEMQQALARALDDGCDALVMAAAVADYRPLEGLGLVAGKMKRSAAKGSRWSWSPDPRPARRRSAQLVGRARSPALLVGFALETEVGDTLVARARDKLAKKKVDLIVANTAETALGGDTNEVTLVSAAEARALPLTQKLHVADAILDFVRDRLVLVRAG